MKRCMAIILHAVLCAGLLQGCVEPESALGFRLPDGDPEAGRRAFWYLRCTTCHDIRGVETPADDVAASAVDVRVTLGGEVSRVKTYGELVTAIINPSHELASGYREEDVAIEGRSIMESTYVNHVMTVQELIDIVAYLQPQYEVKPPKHNPYIYVY